MNFPFTPSQITEKNSCNAFNVKVIIYNLLRNRQNTMYFGIYRPFKAMWFSHFLLYCFSTYFYSWLFRYLLVLFIHSLAHSLLCSWRCLECLPCMSSGHRHWWHSREHSSDTPIIQLGYSDLFPQQLAQLGQSSRWGLIQLGIVRAQQGTCRRTKLNNAVYMWL